MKKAFRALACVLALLIPLASFASYTDSEAYNVTRRVIAKTLENEGCSDLRFAILDYRVQHDGALYAVYSDVKYVDARGKDHRDYFAFMFHETAEGYEPYLLVMGTRLVIIPA